MKLSTWDPNLLHAIGKKIDIWIIDLTWKIANWNKIAIELMAIYSMENLKACNNRQKISSSRSISK
jgi:hypothetical protein